MEKIFKKQFNTGNIFIRGYEIRENISMSLSALKIFKWEYL